MARWRFESFTDLASHTQQKKRVAYMAPIFYNFHTFIKSNYERKYRQGLG